MSGLPMGFVPASRSTVRVLWLLDVVAWIVTVVCGVRVAAGGSTTVEYVLSSTPWRIDAFATIWIVGGLAGLVTRFLKLGIAEVPAISATLTALVVFEVLLAYAITHGFQAGLMPWVLLLPICSLTGRWVVLHDLGRRRPRRVQPYHRQG